MPITPNPKSYFDKYRKSTSSSTTAASAPRLSLDFPRRKSSADVTDLSGCHPRRTGSSSSSSSSRYLLSDTPLLLDLLSDDDPRHHHHHRQHYYSKNNSNNVVSSKKHDFKNYPVFRSSSLSTYSYENPVFESCSSSPSKMGSKVDFFHAQKSSSSSLSRLNHHHDQKPRVNDDEFHVQKSSLSRTSAAKSSSLVTCKDESYGFHSKSGRPGRDQVVELRVSIHCKGCESKIRKHISRMEGVSSFNIDLATKKVTVIGNVTPLGVLTSISKVKNAEFWPSPASSSSSSSSTSSSSSSTTTSTSSSGVLSIVSN